MPQGEVVIDPFTGQSLSREELDELLVPYKRSAAGCWAISTCRSACSCRRRRRATIIARMLRNLKEIHRGAEDWPRLLAVQERLVVLLPTPGKSGATAASRYAELGAVDGRRRRPVRPTSSTCRTRDDR